MQGSELIGGAAWPSPAAPPQAVLRGTWRRLRPRVGVGLLCITTLLERLAHFAVITLLALHLNEHQGYTQAEALALCGGYGALVYAVALGGGWLADRLAMHCVSVWLGALILSLGYLGLAVSAMPIWLALFVLVGGHALFKPSLAVLFGRIEGVPTETSYRLLYLMVNLGGLLGPLLAQGALSRADSTAPFLLASGVSLLSMVAGLAAMKTLRPKEADRIPSAPAEAPSAPERMRTERRARLAALGALCVLLILFFVAFQQTEGSLIFWARDRTDRTLAGYTVPTLWLACLPCLCLLAVNTPLSALWSFCARRGREPGLLTKLRIGMMTAALSFGILWAIARSTTSTEKLGMHWLLLINLSLATAELCVVPVGMTLVRRFAPPGMEGVGMGVWCLIMALGNGIAGQAGGLISKGSGSRGWAVLVALLLGGLLISYSRRLRAPLDASLRDRDERPKGACLPASFSTRARTSSMNRRRLAG